MLIVILILLLLLLAGAFPANGYGFTAWGPYGTQRVLATIIVIVLIVAALRYV